MFFRGFRGHLIYGKRVKDIRRGSPRTGGGGDRQAAAGGGVWQPRYAYQQGAGSARAGGGAGVLRAGAAGVCVPGGGEGGRDPGERHLAGGLSLPEPDDRGECHRVGPVVRGEETAVSGQHLHLSRGWRRSP